MASLAVKLICVESNICVELLGTLLPEDATVSRQKSEQSLIQNRIC